jgi:DNA-binding transcriptional LysR family regulator
LLLGSLKLKQLRLLVALDDDRKLQLAAERLNLSQSAASKMLTEIEAIARVPLFDRNARGVEPTAYGMILIRSGRKVLADLDRATDELAGYKAGDVGNVAVGAVAGPSGELVIDTIQYLGERLNRIKISLHVANSPNLVGRLLALELDFVAARIPVDVDPALFDYHEIGKEEICLLVRLDHPLAGDDIVDVPQMVDFQWILEQRGSILRQRIEQLFGSHGCASPQRIIETDSYFASLGIVARTDAIVRAPMLVTDLVNPQRFTTLRLAEKLTIDSYGLIKLKDRVLSPAAMVVFDAMNRFNQTGQAKTL